MKSFYDRLRYDIVPPFFLILFTLLVHVFLKLGDVDREISPFSVGSSFAWKIVIFVYIWAFISLKVRYHQNGIGIYNEVFLRQRFSKIFVKISWYIYIITNFGKVQKSKCIPAF